MLLAILPESGSSLRPLPFTTVYITVLGLTITTDPQGYTSLEPRHRYIYESCESEFRREIETGEHGLVMTYPGLFRRVW